MDIMTEAELATARHRLAATKAGGFIIVFREKLTVDIVDHVIPYAANADAPIMFISTRANEHCSVGQRGLLARLPGRPAIVGTGRRLAMQRSCLAGRMTADEMLANNRFVSSVDLIEQETSGATVVRFA